MPTNVESMAFQLEISAEAERDYELIFDHLLKGYTSFGENIENAVEHAEARVLEIRAAAHRISLAPHRGERHDDILSGLRHLTINRSIFWFDVDETNECVRILAVFFGGQDHVRRMMVRLIDS